MFFRMYSSSKNDYSIYSNIRTLANFALHSAVWSLYVAKLITAPQPLSEMENDTEKEKERTQMKTITILNIDANTLKMITVVE